MWCNLTLNILHCLILYQKWIGYKKLVPDNHSTKYMILSAKIFVPYIWEEAKFYCPCSGRIYWVLSNLWSFNYNFSVNQYYDQELVADLLDLSLRETLFKYLVLLQSIFICTNYSYTFPIFRILLIVNMIMRDFKKCSLHTFLCKFYII